MNRDIARFLIGVLGLIVVVSVMQWFVTIATPAPSGAPATRLVLKNVSAQVDLFREHCGRYPTVEEGLVALLVRPDSPDLASRWLGPYVKSAVTDGWGRELNYAVPATGIAYRIWSPGPDGLSGTPDDIEVSKPLP